MGATNEGEFEEASANCKEESYRIILDSCGELPEELKSDDRFRQVALLIRIGEDTVVDDASFDQADFLKKVAAYPTSPQSACPSPDSYIEAIRGEVDNVFIITLSERLSGSYSCADLASKLYREECDDNEKNIHVFNSKSASCGETQIAFKIIECIEEGMNFKQVVHAVDQYIESMNTYFVLETLEHLRKNGRLTGVRALVASTLNIKPVMGSTPEGEIQQLATARGVNKALQKMIDIIEKDFPDSVNRRLAIAHCNCKERAIWVKEELLKRMKFMDIMILDTAGISTLYAGDGGIIVTI
ncbi:MAG TPA: DegV family protein [Lachnospiraceae bacterium]|jgi:DegV family protein with EDD domain|nr:DegV family protein [Lachnospiraceae bacterium]